MGTLKSMASNLDDCFLEIKRTRDWSEALTIGLLACRFSLILSTFSKDVR
jgi:hypothetical protein